MYFISDTYINCSFYDGKKIIKLVNSILLAVDL